MSAMNPAPTRTTLVLLMASSPGRVLLRQRQVLLGDVRESPPLQLAGPCAKVIGRDPEQIHVNDGAHVLLRAQFVEDVPHRLVSPVVRRLREQDRRKTLLDVRELGG